MILDSEHEENGETFQIDSAVSALRTGLFSVQATAILPVTWRS